MRELLILILLRLDYFLLKESNTALTCSSATFVSALISSYVYTTYVLEEPRALTLAMYSGLSRIPAQALLICSAVSLLMEAGP